MSHLVFTAFDGPEYFGGPTVNAVRLLPELRRRGHRVTALLVTLGETTSHEASLRSAGVDCRIIRKRGAAEDLVRSTLALLEELRPTIFVPNIWIPGCFAARWLREAGVPTVAAYRSDDPLYDGIIDQFVVGETEWAVSGLVCVSNDLEQRVRSRNPSRTRTAVIASGVAIPDQLHVHGDGFRIAYVGRISQQQKRVLDVARVMVAALEKIPHAEGAFIGHGSESSDLRAVIADTAIADRIEITRPIAPDSIQEHLLGFDVILLLSDYEGTPGALMDAMACGVVPVSTDIAGGIRELVKHGETGVLVKDRGQSAIDEIENLNRDVEFRRELGRRAREHIAAGFSLDHAAARWEQFCEQLLAEAGPAKTLVPPPRIALPKLAPTLAPFVDRRPHLVRRALNFTRRRLLSAFAPRRGNGSLSPR